VTHAERIQEVHPARKRSRHGGRHRHRRSFCGVVGTLTKDLLTPLIAAIVKAPDFSGLTFTLNGSKFMYGEFLNALISFLLVAAAVYFFVVTPINALVARMRKDPVPADPTTKKCPSASARFPSKPAAALSARNR